MGLRNLCVKYRNKITMGHININSISHRFDVLSSLLAGRNDIPIVVEYKQFITKRFPDDGYSTIYLNS